jgi:serine/threonine protein kinase
MEYIKGIDLFDWLIKLNSRDEAKICNTFKTILDAIEITHSRGIVHGYIQV